MKNACRRVGITRWPYSRSRPNLPDGQSHFSGQSGVEIPASSDTLLQTEDGSSSETSESTSYEATQSVGILTDEESSQMVSSGLGTIRESVQDPNTVNHVTFQVDMPAFDGSFQAVSFNYNEAPNNFRKHIGEREEDFPPLNEGWIHNFIESI